jgi:hypothetical protein
MARDHLEFARLQRVKQTRPAAFDTLGGAVVGFFKASVEKRRVKFGKIAECWAKVVPEPLAEHCCLESFARGTLTVIVDSASHLYDLKHHLLDGAEKQLLLACRSMGLRKISAKRGTWE